MSRRESISSILIIGAGLLAGCASMRGPTPIPPVPGSCGARILRPYPAFGERGILSIYKFELHGPNRRDRALFFGGLKRARVRIAPIMLGGQSTVFLISRRPLRSDGELFREVRAICALEQRRTIVLADYQHSVPEAPR